MELEVIACTLEDALAAQEGGATRLEITVQLDHAGLTPPVGLVDKIVRRTHLAVRVMLRERPAFVLSGQEELRILKLKAWELTSLEIDGVVMGFIKNGELDVETLSEIAAAAPSMRFTIHHALEQTADPLRALRAARTLPYVDRALVHGGRGTLDERIERLRARKEALGPERNLIVGGGVRLEMLSPLHEKTGIREFHLGRAVRTPQENQGAVDAAKVRKAAQLLAI